LSVTNWFTNGVWAGEATFPNQAAQVALEVVDPEGHSGASGQFDLRPQADLGVDTVLSAQMPNVGYPIVLTLSVTNRGPLNAPEVRLTSRIAGNLVVSSAMTSLGVPGRIRIVSCDLGAAGNGDRRTVTIVASALFRLITNVATVVSAETDAFTGNNSSPRRCSSSQHLALRQHHAAGTRRRGHQRHGGGLPRTPERRMDSVDYDPFWLRAGRD
jgi:hypothetical protein